ncbi:MAG: hypothetical protein KAX84_06950 [Burkholderiales bacterium]|nr:hypothetical protein [Burkholderiales bacterium]
MRSFARTLSAIALAGAISLPAAGAEYLANGNFEAGLTGWSKADAAGGDGTFSVQSGTTSPINANPVPAPPGGANAAMSDAGAPGAHVLWQDFTIASTAPQFLLRFDLFIGNRAGLFGTPAPATLDFGINAANQQVRVDILAAAAGTFSVAPGDVLLAVYQSQAGDPLVAGYASLSFDITALVNANLGNTLRLRFAQTDNLMQLQAGVDNISVVGVQADMAVDLSGLPATATVGVPYAGTILCTNGALATAPATNATCSVGGLPAGVTLGACSPAPPATLAPGSSITCPVAGTPTVAGPVSVNVTTGAANDPNTANNAGAAAISVAGMVAAVPSPVPALGVWMLVLLALLLPGFAAPHVRKKR